MDAIKPSTSQPTSNLNKETTKTANQLSATNETEISVIDKNTEVVINRGNDIPVKATPTATELLSASIEKVAKEQSLQEVSTTEESIAIQAQVKLTQSITSAARNHPDSKMKDINLNTTTGLCNYSYIYVARYVVILLSLS